MSKDVLHSQLATRSRLFALDSDLWRDTHFVANLKNLVFINCNTMHMAEITMNRRRTGGVSVDCG
jgi:hypothetical protein